MNYLVWATVILYYNLDHHLSNMAKTCTRKDYIGKDFLKTDVALEITMVHLFEDSLNGKFE